ncbi:peptidoglycan-binding domain-containing protein [Labrys okinawensis]|uniref:peptidoglycan-binding domain-containing protein n=1 Tax=Labrys okinawensis TaxID=346911 RepID=UPI0039BD363C
MLISSLFRDDPRLQACLVDDTAHLTVGTQGRAVAKVQMALLALDWLRIDDGEIRSQTYGSSTAAAVLSFKSKRGIINYSYQRTADNIVGKMTIAALDKEMAVWEKASRRLDICSCCPPGNLVSPPPSDTRFFASEVSLSTPSSVGSGAKPKQFNKTLHIYCSMSKKTEREGGFNFQPQVDFANARLKNFGMQIAVDFSSATSPDVIDFVDSIVLEEDVALARQACENKHSGSPGVLRVMACHRGINAPPGQTFRGVTVGGVVFKTFVILNSNLTTSTTPKDNNVLIHEMIHASHAKIEIHDSELDSVFTEYVRTQSNESQPARTILKENRALELSSGYFAT